MKDHGLGRNEMILEIEHMACPVGNPMLDIDRRAYTVAALLLY